MSLTEKIDLDLKQAMIAKDEVRLSTIRMLKSAVKYVAIEKSASLTDSPSARFASRRKMVVEHFSLRDFTEPSANRK